MTSTNIYEYEYINPHTNTAETFTYNSPNITHVVEVHNASREHVVMRDQDRAHDRGVRLSAHESMTSAENTAAQHREWKADADARIAPAVRTD